MIRICVLFAYFSLFLSTSNASEVELPESLIKTLEGVRNRALDWLYSQMTEEFGWASGETTRVVIAIASAIENWPKKNDLTARLIAKQLEIELLEILLSNDETENPGKIAYSSLALFGICKNPHDFYGHNLIGSLLRHQQREKKENQGYSESYEFSLSSLATCLSGEIHLHKRQVRYLLQISRDDSKPPHSFDTGGMALMALECIRQSKRSSSFTKHLREYLIEKISKHQSPDGSFGNIETTSMAIQALASTSEINVSWNRTAAILALEAMQEPNGSYHGSIQSTTQAILAVATILNGKGLLGLKKNRCSSASKQQKIYRFQETGINNCSLLYNYLDTYDSNANDIHRKPESGLENSSSSAVNHGELSSTPPTTLMLEYANITYCLWVGYEPAKNDTKKYSLNLSVPVNTTFFNVMQRAAEISENFEFSSTVWPNGHYVHTISGQREQSIGYNYWLLYRLPTDPDPNNPPPTTLIAPAGVDDLLVQNRDVYLFWYKRL